MKSPQPREVVATGDEDEPKLSCLPLEVLASISSNTGQHSTRVHPLLKVCRATRDAVLQGLKNVELCITNDEDGSTVGRLARMLHRACCTATPGLKVKLCWRNLKCEQGVLTNLLLAPGIQSQGWHNVHYLALDGTNLTAQQLSYAFPALHTLDLHFVDLNNGVLLGLLQQCHPQLHRLILSRCKMHHEAVASCAAALANLPSLTAFEASTDICFELSTQLTGLTSLVANTPAGVTPATTHKLERYMQTAKPSLVSWKLVEPYAAEVPSLEFPVQPLQQLLVGCTSLTELDLSGREIDLSGLDVLLTYGSSITSLSVSSFSLSGDHSRSKHPCSWQVLQIQRTANSAQQLGLLPLHGVQTLRVSGSDHTLPLNLPAVIIDEEDMPSVLHQAATNLATCPAMMRGQYTTVQLSFNNVELGEDEQDVQLGPDETVDLMEGLAPLAGTFRHLIIDCHDLYLNGAAVEGLGRVLGSSLTSLSFYSVYHLDPTFWVSLHQALPNLTQLFLGDDIGTHASSISLFCALRAARPPPSGAPLVVTLNAVATRRFKGFALRAGVKAMAEQLNSNSVQVVLLDRKGNPVGDLGEAQQLEACDDYDSYE